MTDGQWFFKPATEIVAGCAGKYFPEMIVVAIGATPEAIERKEELMRRSYDFTTADMKTFVGPGRTLVEREMSAREKVAGNKPVSELGGGF